VVGLVILNKQPVNVTVNVTGDFPTSMPGRAKSLLAPPGGSDSLASDGITWAGQTFNNSNGELLGEEVIELVDDYSAVTLEPYSTKVIYWVDACGGEPCQNGGTCSNQATSFSPSCKCADGFTGDRCETKDSNSAGSSLVFWLHLGCFVHLDLDCRIIIVFK
jgi:hypothetical protein